MDQIKEYNPPPNPAKTTDSRYANYIQLYGAESWELDALEPNLLADLVRESVLSFRNNRRWNADLKVEQAGKDRLSLLADQES